MKYAFTMKDPNFLDYAVKELEEKLAKEGKDEGEVEVITDAFKKKFRYGEYLMLEFDTEAGMIKAL